MRRLWRMTISMRLSFAGLTLVLATAAAQVKTGPDPGTKIPAFELPDQHGRTRTFENLRGRKGLVLAFVRSADW